jgi:predicted acylesterase/phospholipase RssA
MTISPNERGFDATRAREFLDLLFVLMSNAGSSSVPAPVLASLEQPARAFAANAHFGVKVVPSAAARDLASLVEFFIQLMHDAQPHRQNNQSVELGDSGRPLVLALSGGGLRATLFHLGILVYLSVTRRLDQVAGITSVSGGSIIAGHFAAAWETAVRDQEGFDSVAASLVRFARSNVRDSVLIPWLWSRPLLCWWRRSLGRTARLDAIYRKHFGNLTLGDLACSKCPRITFVATDSIRQERVAFAADGVKRFPLRPDPESVELPAVPASGVRLSLAVAASSCFPPVFRRMRLTHEDLGLTFGRFKDMLTVNDGGVMDNLGIRVLLDRRARDDIGAGTGFGDPLVCVRARRPNRHQFAELLVLDSWRNGMSAAANMRSRCMG